MRILKRTEDLRAFCDRARKFEFLTFDTEFVGERSYYPKLCLIQLALPSKGSNSAVLVDPTCSELELEPVFELFRDESVLKVCHAGRADMEIFLNLAGDLPTPVFDTQIAAMVCGFGDQVGYQKLVRKVTGKRLSKSMRITDWSRRPLSTRQKNYAISDVTHLRQVYRALKEMLSESGRKHWLTEEMDRLENPEGYGVDPDLAWKRIRARNMSGVHLAVLRELAGDREREAMCRDQPRKQVVSDEALLEIAGMLPKNRGQLLKSRFLRGRNRNKEGNYILD